jgi:hypothetical protein
MNRVSEVTRNAGDGLAQRQPAWYPPENALLRIIRKAKVRPVRARGRIAEGWSEGSSLSPLSFEGYAIDLNSDVELCSFENSGAAALK